MDEIHEKCGVAAVHIKKGSKHEGRAPYFLYRLLLNMQNRGQLAAGITVYHPEKTQLIDTYKDLGTVNEVFKTSHVEKRDQIFKDYSANKGIGHTRYATFGKDTRIYGQPFERHHGRKWKWFSFCFNGNIANFTQLKKILIHKTDYHMVYNTDTEIIMHYLSKQLQTRKEPNLVEVFRSISRKFDGAYNIAFINALGTIVVCRDPLGIRPMCYGTVDGVTLIASESNALANCGVANINYLKPGELIIIDDDKFRIKRFAENKETRRCMFEWVYFANVSSNLDHKSVYLARTNLGRELAKLETIKTDDTYIVIPVPDSSKPAGEAYAYALGLPSVEGLVRNRYVGRIFIESRERADKVRNKFTVLREIVEGKKIMLVDDSIVRGTTSKNIVKYIKEVGKAKEVHLRVSCPPIISPCFYGIDMSNLDELFAAKYMKYMKNGNLPYDIQQKMAKTIGADSLIYQTIEGLIRSIGFPKNELCLACITGNYPTRYGQKLYGKALKNSKRRIKLKKRIYE